MVLLFGLLPILQFPGYHDRTIHLVNEPLFLRQDGEVLGHFYVLLVQHQKFDVLRVAFTAKQQADRIFFAGLHLVLLEVLEVKFHLAFVLRLELAQLKVNGQ